MYHLLFPGIIKMFLVSLQKGQNVPETEALNDRQRMKEEDKERDLGFSEPIHQVCLTYL